MASREHQPQQVVADRVVKRRVEIWHCRLFQLQLAHDPRQSGNEPRRLDPPDCLNRTMCIGSHCYRSHHASLHRRKGKHRTVSVLLFGCRNRQLRYALSKIFRPEHLANLGLALPSRPVFLVKLHEAYRRVDGLFLGLQLKLRIPSDDFLGLGERPVGHGHPPSGKPDARAQRGWPEPPAADHCAGFDILFGEDGDGVHQFLGRWALPLGVLDDHHESHGNDSFIFHFEIELRAGFPLGLDRIKSLALLIRRTNFCEIDTRIDYFFWTPCRPRIERQARSSRVRLRYHQARFFSTCCRNRSSRSFSSGVNWAPKSSASNTWRISTSAPPPNGLRLSHSTASSMDLTCHSQKPAISSLVSVKGPSMTVGFSPEKRTRLPLELACSPSPASMTPAFTSSSLYLPIFVRISVLGRMPASESLLALTITMTLIVMSPS